jgi:hypothetical protein
MTILTSAGVQFSDATQITQGVPLTGGTVTGRLALPYLSVYNGSQTPGSNYNSANMQNIRQWNYSYTHTQNTIQYFVNNSNSYDDVTFQLNIVSYSGYILYGILLGTFGGYGISYTAYGGAFSYYTPVCDNTTTSGYGKFGLSLGSIYSGAAGVNISMTVFGKNPITAIVGTLH